jgi:hypothetical protein
MSSPGAIEEITPVPEAHVPIIKLEYSGISVDLIYASIPTVSSVDMQLDLVSNNQILQGLDDTDMRSVNGTRVADQMLTLVPETKTFRQALRAIKLWANRMSKIYAASLVFVADCDRPRHLCQCRRFPRRRCLGVDGGSCVPALPLCYGIYTCCQILQHYRHMEVA